ncbi:MAG: hypothetical protein IH859_04120, partial [Chloroflexi bacterium]|nr:hypothetical protein [Chloroflexota bacterium]
QELVYCFESAVRGAEITWSRSDSVRFYVNGVLHYLCALFLLDWNRNKKKELPRAGTIIKVLHPIGLDQLVNRIYEIFERKFGDEYTYGETIRQIRNKHIVHGSFSPKNIKELVNDNKIFSLIQQARFVSNHYDLYNQIILLRLRLVSILTAFEVDPSTYSAKTLYGV